MHATKICPAAHAAVLATSQAIRHGKVGLDFTGPDTASIEWTPEAVGHVMEAIAVVDPLLVKEWIEELLHMAEAPPELLLQSHPDWHRESEKFEEDMGYSPFASDDEEHRYFDNIERALSARGALNG